MTWPRPSSSLFPYTTLFRSDAVLGRPRSPYLCVQGRLAPGATPAACSRWKRPPRGGLGRASSLAVFMRRRSEEHTSELQSRENLVCRLLLEKKKTQQSTAKI